MSDFAYTYVLECGDGKLYVGSTIDLKRRVEEHLRGVVPATQYRLPVRLVCYEACRAFRHRPDGRNDPRSVARRPFPTTTPNRSWRFSGT